MKLARKKRLQRKREELESAKNPKLTPEQQLALAEKQRVERLRLKKKLHFGTYGVKYVKNSPKNNFSAKPGKLINFK